LRSSDNVGLILGWGVSTDIPVPGDYDHDLKADLAVYRPSQGYWYINTSSNNGNVILGWGAGTDVPQPADYDGDGLCDLAIHRDSNTTWIAHASPPGAPLTLPLPLFCGDGVCNAGETCSTCQSDCGVCPYCGDFACNGGETCGTCPGDCGACPP